MNGQWIGTYSGTNVGEIIVNVDDRGSHFQGVTYVNDGTAGLPRITASFQTENKAADFGFRPDQLWAVHPHTSDRDYWDNIKQLYPADVVIPTTADVTGHWDEQLSASGMADGHRDVWFLCVAEIAGRSAISLDSSTDGVDRL
jgi:hypothetical protein